MNAVPSCLQHLKSDRQCGQESFFISVVMDPPKRFKHYVSAVSKKLVKETIDLLTTSKCTSSIPNARATLDRLRMEPVIVIGSKLQQWQCKLTLSSFSSALGVTGWVSLLVNAEPLLLRPSWLRFRLRLPKQQNSDDMNPRLRRFLFGFRVT